MEPDLQMLVYSFAEGILYDAEKSIERHSEYRIGQPEKIFRKQKTKCRKGITARGTGYGNRPIDKVCEQYIENTGICTPCKQTCITIHGATLDIKSIQRIYHPDISA